MKFPPLINDITTTPNSPPILYVFPEEKVLPYPDHFAKLQQSYYSDLKPFYTTQEANHLFKLILRLLNENFPWKILKTNEAECWIQLLAKTLLLRYKDDIAIQVRKEKNGSSVHLRSKSRVGRGDYGANAKRIRHFMRKLEKSLKSD